MTKSSQKIESGRRMSFKIELKAKVDNIYDLEEVKHLKSCNLLILLKKYCKEFSEITETNPTSISLDSDLLYLARDEISKDTGKYTSSDNVFWEGIKLKSACSGNDGDIIISSWSEVLIGS